jgi:hypothetical protein
MGPDTVFRVSTPIERNRQKKTVSGPISLNRLFVATLLVSASAIAFEILLMRMLSIVQWHHFAYMIISLALLGYGASGTFIALGKRILEPRFELAFSLAALLFACSPYR